MANNSDYNKNRTNLLNLLPDVFQSDTAKSVYENVLNRFLTKSEVHRVTGYVGEGASNAVIDRQIKEPTIYRQSQQLQPILYQKIGSVEHMASWKDILNEMERVGVDVERLNEWGSVQRFNWAPPIDLDKLNHYQDYYWYDPDDPSSRPHYITVRNNCTTSQAKVNFWDALIQDYGSTISIKGVDTVNDQLYVDGRDYTNLFRNGFVFYVTNSSNSDLNNTYLTVQTSTYDPQQGSGGRTIITLTTDINDNTGDGEISLEERRNVVIAEKDCRCEGTVGWDVFQWDDNQIPGNVIWNTGLLASITQPTESSWVQQNGSPTVTSLWYDTTTDQLKQYNGSTWIVVRNAFSVIVAETQGYAYWDSSSSCGVNSTNVELEQWSSKNKWVHRNDVPNFSIAKKADIPIIEYNPDIEINSWTYTKHKWMYRFSQFENWETVKEGPSLFEIKPVTGSDYQIDPENNNPNLIEFDPKYGDLSSLFQKGYLIRATGVADPLTVLNSYYKLSTSTSWGSPSTGPYYSTYVEIDDASVILSKPDLSPHRTTQDDPWKGYGIHWWYRGVDEVVPVNHQTLNPFTPINEATATYNEAYFNDGGEHYSYTISDFAELINIIDSSGIPVGNVIDLHPSLQMINLSNDSNDLRIYVNGVRQYGDFSIVTSGTFVEGIKFDYKLNQDDSVLVELGPAAFGDWGWEDVEVRISDGYPSYTTKRMSLTSYHKAEQIKSETIVNQYPLFDIYNVEGVNVNRANKIFGYRESPDAEVLAPIGRRVVRNGSDYQFEQFLIDQDNGPLFAYRDYTKREYQYWVNPRTDSVYFWDQYTWSDKKDMGGFYQKAIVSFDEPSSPFEELVWFDKKTKTLYEYNNGSWVVLDFHLQTSDPTVETIWKAGNNKEKYVPEKVDEKGRTLDEYNAQKDAYIREQSRKILVKNSSLSQTKAEQQALLQWYDEDSSKLRPSGQWVGDWEVPEPLIHNNQHENRKIISTRELLTHFNSIIEHQEQIPAFSGPPKTMFHLLDTDEVNYGVGGIINEYNDGFDTFLSSVFINNITPPGLVEFAQDEYENGLTQISELFRQQIKDEMLNLSASSLNSLGSSIAENIISEYEQNSYQNSLYGDSTVYNEGTQEGMKNWIATLPYFGLTNKTKPYFVHDTKNNINQVIHHDGHRGDYTLPNVVVEGIVQRTINTNDQRASGEKFGKQGSTLPPNTINEFTSQLSLNMRTGVYWYYVNGDTKQLYRFSVVSVGSTEPSLSYDDGSLWLDTTPGSEVLRVKNGLSWDIVQGLSVGDGRLHNGFDPQDVTTSTISAWKAINLNEILGSVILSVEQKLYENLPVVIDQKLDYESLRTAHQQTYDAYIENAFTEYAHERGIVAPFSSENTFSSTEPFTWNYVYSTINTFPSSANNGTESGGYWKDLYEKLYRTPFPHLEPWKLQGYNDKPSWWDSEYLNDDPATYGNRKWKYIHNPSQNNPPYGTGMWENIRIAVVPAGYEYPDGTISTGVSQENPNVPTYQYFSVNIGNTVVSTDGGNTNYYPDEILPPYWDFTQVFGLSPSGSDAIVRSVFSDFNNEIQTPGADFVFNDRGPIEWEWRKSSQYLYDLVKVYYKIDPIRMVSKTFGIDFITIGDLQIDSRTNNTFAHNRTIFHGDLINTNQLYKVNGINQWLVNYNRYAGYDLNFADFNELWVNWTAPMMYQFASFLDTTSFRISNDNVIVSDFDYNITIKKSPGVNDYWLNSFKVNVLNIPPSVISYDNQSQWKFQVDTYSPIGQSLSYYDVKKFQFHADENTNICTLYKYPIKDVNVSNNTFSVDGNVTDIFTVGLTFTVSETAGNNGDYTVKKVVYDGINKNTVITTNENVSNATVLGFITADYRKLPFETGDSVYFETDQVLPAPIDGNLMYFIIKVSENQFKIALTPKDAESGTEIDLLGSGVKSHYVGSVNSTFRALNGQTTPKSWRHYELDKTSIKTVTPPFEVHGIQEIINVIDGYAAFIEDKGFRINQTGELIDPLTGRIAGWQVELERLIDWLYNLRRTRNQVEDGYSVEVDTLTDVWSFTDTQPSFTTGQRVRLMGNKALPSPLNPGDDYYIIRDSQTDFRLAATKADALAGNEVDILSDANVDQVHIYRIQNLIAESPQTEINPFRNGVWFAPESGVVSNVITGSQLDIRSQQTLFDQYGRKLPSDKIYVLREDKLTQINIDDQIENDVHKSTFGDEYNFLHLAGIHLFTDNYEHVLKLNDYTTEGILLYDPFVGLYSTKYDMSYFRQDQFTERPNVGGHYLTQQYNQGGELKRNIEASIDDMRQYYDTYQLPETIKTAQYSRDLLGYEGTHTYLDYLGLNDKSQFVFWRGLIQSKGSINAMNAYINSRRFIDAKMDEYWAVKVAEFGSIEEQEYPELYLMKSNFDVTNIKLQFLDQGQPASASDPGFDGITTTNQEHWFNQPNQQEKLKDNGNHMLFELKPYHKETLNNVDYYDYGSERVIRHRFAADAVMISYVMNGGTYFVDPSEITNVTTEITKVNINSIIGISDSEITIWGLNVNEDAQNPAYLIDKDADVVVSPITIWDPARGFNFYRSESQIDLRTNSDPAEYNNANSTVNSTSFWNKPEVGTTWLDTSQIYYKPYYDKRIFDDVDVRIKNWGALTDFANVSLYTWFESDTPPGDWTGDGTPRSVLMEGNSPWVRYHETFDVFYDTNVVSAPLVNTSGDNWEVTTNIPDGYDVNVYINGVKIKETTVNPGGTVTFTSKMSDVDRLDVVRKYPTSQEIENSNGTLHYVYDYTTVDHYDQFGNITTKYYFWITNRTEDTEGLTMSQTNLVNQYIRIPEPFMAFDGVQTVTKTTPTGTYDVPDYFSKVIINGLRDNVDGQRRYTIKFTRDFTLRDCLDDTEYNKNVSLKKDLHQEWELFREEQQFNIRRDLWDQITEAMVGYKLDDNTVRVPSLSRELYDETYGTDTQYGLGDGQAFTNGETAIETIKSYLKDPNIDFYPVNIDVFLSNNNFDTPQEIISTMNNIYNTFPYEHVNKMFFSVLYDAFSYKSKYQDIFKTSMIALHGIKVLETQGIFDD